ncbi:vesicle transport protein USE1 isoform X1 [Acomys russatus]|uniref:vesicle transport protein USE1 isoform X1 n=1 Tax=Acomys russatus TaxID=60746 RepID=UPI0021E2E264|nr:vesicle transport protein USE1 isoform X1 [Acomys russatus]
MTWLWNLRTELGMLRSKNSMTRDRSWRARPSNQGSSDVMAVPGPTGLQRDSASQSENMPNNNITILERCSPGRRTIYPCINCGFKKTKNATSVPSVAGQVLEGRDDRPEDPAQALPPLSKMAQAEGACHRPLATSRLELNLVRLLCRCESMAAAKREPDEWRLEKYVGALEDMLQALKVQASKPASEVISEYSRKVDFLKGMLQAEKLTSSSEKALANQFLAPGRVPTTARERVPATKTVHLQSRARYTSEMRSELLGTVRFSLSLVPGANL